MSSMSPNNKKNNQRSSKSKVREDSENQTLLKNVVNASSIVDKRAKSKVKVKDMNNKNKKRVADQQKQTSESKSTKSFPNLIDSLPSSSMKSNLDLTEKKDDSLCDSEDFLGSQFSSQDNLLLDSSQDDMHCEVRWDYTSPETMKQLKKMRGKYCVQDVKRMIANFPDLPMKQIPIPPSLHQIKFSIPQRNDDAIAEKHRIQKAKQRAAKKWQQREKCRGAVEDMLLFLQQQQEKQENASATERPVEVSLEKDLHSEVKANENKQSASGFDDNWSDDDLFRDNSFLIEATQNLEKVFPLLNQAPDKQQNILNSDSPNATSGGMSLNSGDMFLSTLSSSYSVNSIVNSTSVIPSSYAGKLGKGKCVPPVKMLLDQRNDMKKNCDKVSVNKINPNYPIYKPNDMGNTAASCVSNCNVNNPSYDLTSRGPNSSSGIVRSGMNMNKPNVRNQQNRVREITSTSGSNSGLDSSQRTIFRRHHTFQGNQASNKPSVVKGPSPSLNSPFRRYLSFDDRNTPNCNTNVGSKGTGGTGHSKSKTIPSHQNISFDSSLTDELLMQATEDVDSACVNLLVNQKTSDNDIGKPSFKCDQQPCASSKPINLSNPANCYKTSDDLDITNTLLSPVKPLFQDSNVKRLQSKMCNSPVQSYFKKSFAIVDGQQSLKHKSQPGPHSSTPIKVAKTDEEIDCAADKPQVDRGLDSFMDDDSFMNDEAMFESQILPILQLAETQVTAKKNLEPKSPTKYSPDEIEKKRQVALQKLRKNECIRPTQEKMQMDDCTRTLEFEQTQASSPRKCSQDEIDRKKQAAQRKLRSKTNSTGSLHVSPGSGSISTPEYNASHKVSVNETSPHKCSQEEIKMKREEALKKRRLKLQLAPTRKL